MSTKTPSLFGDAVITAGTIIGAGILTNPITTSGVWFADSLVMLLYAWFSMPSSGLVILEINTYYPYGASFDTMIKDLLRPTWGVIGGTAIAFVLYLLIYAYIFADGDLTAKGLGSTVGNDVSFTVGQLVFFGILAFCVWVSAQLINRPTDILIGDMVLTLIRATGELIAGTKLPILFNTQAPAGTSYWTYAATALPVCLASPDLHDSVSNLPKYFRDDMPRVTKSFWVDMLIALVIYVLWQITIQGNLSRSEFTPIIAAEGQVSILIETLFEFVQTDSMDRVLTLFSYMAIATSSLGVTLGLLDYIAGIFKWNDSTSGRAKTTALTFLPPLTPYPLFPTGFVTTTGYASLTAAVWTDIIPVMLPHRSRKKSDTDKNYEVYGRFGLIVWIFLFSVINITAQVLNQLELVLVSKG